MWSYKTCKGPFHIVERDGRYHLIFDDEDLGNYQSPGQAADDLSRGNCESPSKGFDPGKLGISDNLRDWGWIKSRE